MDIEHIEWCTHMLDKGIEIFNIEDIDDNENELEWVTVEDDCTVSKTVEMDFFYNGCMWWNFELQKEGVFQAARVNKGDGAYVQYIVGLGLQVKDSQGNSVFINKEYPVFSVEDVLNPPAIGGKFSESVVNSNKQSVSQGSSNKSLLTLYNLDDSFEYYGLICLDTFYYLDFYVDVLSEIIETLGLYSIRLGGMLVIARSKGLFLKYFKPVKGEV